MATTTIPEQASKEEKIKRPTLLYSLLFLVVFWAICIVYAWLAAASNPEFDLLHSFIVMGIVALVITFFSFFPAIIYGIFDKWGKERAIKKTAAELRRYNVGLSEKISTEIEDANTHAYEPGSYQFPVLLTTFSMIVGWVLFFFSEGPKPVYEVIKTGTISQVLYNVGNAHPVVFGFLGAFFWALGTLFNRYVRGDLRATVYTNITVRVWSVFALIIVLAVVWGDSPPQALLAASFLIGIFPELGLDLIKKPIKGLGRLRSPTEISLNQIQGLSLWDQGRLEEEGIQNVQNLATSDVVGLLVNTRLSVMSILNWVDQAILMIHAPTSYEFLRKRDIIMATDLEAIYAGRLSPQDSQSLPDGRLTYLGCSGITSIPQPGEGMIKALKQESKDENEVDFDVKERVHNIMTAICDDVCYQRMWQIRHGNPTGGELEKAPAG
jgi:hypothetical protein